MQQIFRGCTQITVPSVCGGERYVSFAGHVAESARKQGSPHLKRPFLPGGEGASAQKDCRLRRFLHRSRGKVVRDKTHFFSLLRCRCNGISGGGEELHVFLSNPRTRRSACPPLHTRWRCSTAQWMCCRVQ